MRPSNDEGSQLFKFHFPCNKGERWIYILSLESATSIQKPRNLLKVAFHPVSCLLHHYTLSSKIGNNKPFPDLWSEHKFKTDFNRLRVSSSKSSLRSSSNFLTSSYACANFFRYKITQKNWISKTFSSSSQRALQNTF